MDLYDAEGGAINVRFLEVRLRFVWSYAQY
jgi:hypothetical protein